MAWVRWWGGGLGRFRTWLGMVGINSGEWEAGDKRDRMERLRLEGGLDWGKWGLYLKGGGSEVGMAWSRRVERRWLCWRWFEAEMVWDKCILVSSLRAYGRPRRVYKFVLG